jgi:hypothetical protein
MPVDLIGRGGDVAGVGDVEDERGESPPTAERANRSPSAGLRIPA